MARVSAVLNLFKQAKDVAPIKLPSTAAGGNGKNSSHVLELGDDLSTLASIKVLMKSLDSLAKVYDDKVKAKMADEFASIAANTGKRPANFTGVSPKAEASCELRKRSVSSYLSDDEIAMLSAKKIPIAEQVVQEAVPERYFFNSELVADVKLAGKISAALATVKELQGLDVILRQPAEPALIRKYVPDTALDAVAATKDIETIKLLLPLVSSMAIRVKMVSAELSDALSLIKAAEISL